MSGGGGGAEGERLVVHLLVPGRLVVGMKEEMRMTLDQAGNKSVVRQIDRLGVVRRDDFRGRPGGFDFVAADEHGPAGMHFLAIEDRGGRRRRATAATGAAAWSGCDD